MLQITEVNAQLLKSLKLLQPQASTSDKETPKQDVAGPSKNPEVKAAVVPAGDVSSITTTPTDDTTPKKDDSDTTLPSLQRLEKTEESSNKDESNDDLMQIDTSSSLEKASDDNTITPPADESKTVIQTSTPASNKRKRASIEEISGKLEPDVKRFKVIPRNASERQQARDGFTSGILHLPEWFPTYFCPLTYIVVKFFWVHEEAAFQMKTVYSNERGQQNPSYRLQFHKVGKKAAEQFDADAKQKFDSDKLATTVSILPWYKKHQRQWSRPNIHPNTAHNSIIKFKLKTRTDFIENFLVQLGGKLSHLKI